MVRKEKDFKKFLENPCSFKFSKIEGLLYSVGFILVSVKGSHRKYRNDDLGLMETIPVHGNDCKRVYKLKLALAIKQIIYGG